jgi:uncharacterized protein (TIGR04255 family)
MMARKYRKPPIVEAVCEFRFQPGRAWDRAFPNQIYDKLKADFPKNRTVQSFQASLNFALKEMKQQINLSDALQVLREDEKAVVTIDVDRLAISQLKPYTTWKEYLPLINQALSVYQEIVQPKGLHRLGIRYINLIEINSALVQLENYLNFYPALQWDLTDDYEAFVIGMQFPFDENRDCLKMQLSNGDSVDPEMSAFVLDLDYFTNQSGIIGFEGVPDWLENAHLRVEAAFEGCIKDSLREIFQEIK